MVLNLSHKIPVRDARPAPAPGKMAALALKIFKTAPPRKCPHFDCNPAPPEDFIPCAAPPQFKRKFPLPRPEAKKAVPASLGAERSVDEFVSLWTCGE